MRIATAAPQGNGAAVRVAWLQALANPRPPHPYNQAVTARLCRQSTIVGASASHEVSPTSTLQSAVEDLSNAGDAQQRYAMLLELAAAMPAMPQEDRTPANRVMACTAPSWLSVSLTPDDRVSVAADSESQLTRGLAALLVGSVQGMTPQEVLDARVDGLGAAAMGVAGVTRSRTNGLLNMFDALQTRVRALVSGQQREPFPALRVSSTGLSAEGAFAEAQAAYLKPDPAAVAALVALLSSKSIGVVAHFYMDPQVQGVLTSAAASWPHIHISDSLVMADSAVGMVAAGCTAIVVLGVDFMSENVGAILAEAGHPDIPVYRLASERIGCSLADAAETPEYYEFLRPGAAPPAAPATQPVDRAQALEVPSEPAEGGAPPSLHVVYINTSLRTKALSHSLVPTITCTSSNVVATVLQAFAQVPDVTVLYGPDSHMGRNLVTLFRGLTELPPEEVAALHPSHTPDTIAAALPRLSFFQQGTCMVHDIFGGDITRRVREEYSDAYLTAHFEVPGAMFDAAMESRVKGMGVVGSTQNILDFILDKTRIALEQPHSEALRFVLGTEVGMVTSVVRRVEALLREADRPDVTVDIVFPVSSEAITTSSQQGAVELPGGLDVVPGPAAGEGCGAEGGCASCPYMKMNSLAALTHVCEAIGTPQQDLLDAYRPEAYTETIAGETMAAVGCVPILHMRDFQKDKVLSETLVRDMADRAARQ